MSKRVDVKTSDGEKSYKVSEGSGTFYCYKGSDKIGSAKNMDDALVIIKSHASNYGKIYSIKIY